MNRPLLHRLFGFWLALLVLTSSVGLTVQQHTCRQSGRHTASVVFSPVRHGCPAPPVARHGSHQTGTTRLAKSCCEFGAHFHKLDASSAKLVAAKVPAPLAVPALPAALMWPVAPVAPRLSARPQWYATDSSPPLRAGRQLLVFVGVLVV